ncbi:MAG: hypothetical protein IJV41_11705 [Oscillospiraceae bacterium]|nr:hypothetical protein [Oscillospiraceae bacterium]
MEVLFRCAAIGIFSALISLLIKRYNPELSFTVTALAAVTILLGCRVFFDTAGDLIKSAKSILNSGTTLVQPVLKCLVIALVTKFSASLCKDASQGALASAVETAGTFCAAAVAAPFVVSLLHTINGMI